MSPVHGVAAERTPGFLVWIVQPEADDLKQAALLVSQDLRSRGLKPTVVNAAGSQDPIPKEPPPDGQATVVVAVLSPSINLLSFRTLVVSREPVFPPAHSVLLSTAPEAASNLALRIVTTLEEAGLISASDDDEVYSPEEEERLRKALDDLGYL